MFTAQAPPLPPFPTFESSNFRRLYDESLPAADGGEVLHAVRELVDNYCQQQAVAPSEGRRSLSTLANDLGTYKDASLPHAADLTSQFVWTSHHHLFVGRARRELCYILNDAIRSDCSPLLEPAARLAR